MYMEILYNTSAGQELFQLLQHCKIFTPQVYALTANLLNVIAMI